MWQPWKVVVVRSLNSPPVPRSDSRNSGARIIDYTSAKLDKLLLFLGLIKGIDLKMESGIIRRNQATCHPWKNLTSIIFFRSDALKYPIIIDSILPSFERSKQRSIIIFRFSIFFKGSKQKSIVFHHFLTFFLIFFERYKKSSMRKNSTIFFFFLQKFGSIFHFLPISRKSVIFQLFSKHFLKYPRRSDGKKNLARIVAPLSSHVLDEERPKQGSRAEK